MHTLGRKPLYRHGGVALLRAAAVPLGHGGDRWPDLSDRQACRGWLRRVWSRPDLAEAIRQASPGLADRAEAMCDGHAVQAKQVRRAAMATVRYLLRATGRHTPFGLFAGVAAVSVGPAALVRWGDDHRCVARVDNQWVTDVVQRLQACPDLLARLDVVFTNLATQRGQRLEAPHGPNWVTIRYTSAVRAVRDASASPIRFGVLADWLARTFPGADGSTVRGMLTELVRQGFLITCLRAPLTLTDPLAHLVDRLNDVAAGSLPAVAPLLCDLEIIRAEVHRHNHESTTGAEQARARATITRRMRELSDAGRTPLAVDLRLDCDVQLPEHVVHELEWAASALVRLTRHPTGEAPWRDFYTAFCHRYGTGTLVPLADVVDPGAGLGLPAGYPGSVLPSPSSGPSEREEKLLALAWQAMADGSTEITLLDETIETLRVGDPAVQRCIPPHVELAARIHATSTQALLRGDYTLTVTPARCAGTLTSRFTGVVTGSGLEAVYAAVPVATEGALPVQLSFPPVYPHAENVCRVPAYLPRVLSLGEHRGHGGDGSVVALDDLAITATGERLHLVSISGERVLEPQVLHALALDKQPPPLARFLAHLSRALGAAWHEFDWGPYAHRLPFLPRVRYRRSVLSPARWRLTTDDLASGATSDDGLALERWRRRWQCPETVELRDADRTLRLTLQEPAHAAIVHAHLRRHGHATLTEAAPPADFGWLHGHAHEIAVPLVTTRPATPSPLAGPCPLLTNGGHGQLPGAPGTVWLYAKIHTHPLLLDELIAEQLPELLATLEDEPLWWFVRYRSPQETDHLRLRIRIPGREQYGACVVAVGAWALRLRQEGMAGRLVLDTYHPETGRYGHGAAMAAAEEVFAADSQTVSAQLRHLPATVINPAALAAVNMVGTVHGFLGTLAGAMQWLLARAAPGAPVAADRAVVERVVGLVRGGMLQQLPGWEGPLAQAWQARTAALAAYRTHLPAEVDTEAILEALLHMHHNRALGIDRDSESTCRRLARQAALAWTAHRDGHHR